MLDNVVIVGTVISGIDEGPGQICVFCTPCMTVFPTLRFVINWIQIWRIWRPHFRWNKFWRNIVVSFFPGHITVVCLWGWTNESENWDSVSLMRVCALRRDRRVTVCLNVGLAMDTQCSIIANWDRMQSLHAAARPLPLTFTKVAGGPHPPTAGPSSSHANPLSLRLQTCHGHRTDGIRTLVTSFDIYTGTTGYSLGCHPSCFWWNVPIFPRVPPKFLPGHQLPRFLMSPWSALWNPTLSCKIAQKTCYLHLTFLEGCTVPPFETIPPTPFHTHASAPSAPRSSCRQRSVCPAFWSARGHMRDGTQRGARWRPTREAQRLGRQNVSSICVRWHNIDWLINW